MASGDAAMVFLRSRSGVGWFATVAGEVAADCAFDAGGRGGTRGGVLENVRSHGTAAAVLATVAGGLGMRDVPMWVESLAASFCLLHPLATFKNGSLHGVCDLAVAQRSARSVITPGASFLTSTHC